MSPSRGLETMPGKTLPSNETWRLSNGRLSPAAWAGTGRYPATAPAATPMDMDRASASEPPDTGASDGSGADEAACPPFSTASTDTFTSAADENRAPCAGR